MTTTITRRVLARYLSAKGLVPNPNPKGHADRVTPEYAEQWLAEHGHGGGKDKEKGHEEHKEHATLKGALSKLSKGALSFLKKAPAAVQAFVQEPETRKKHLQTAATAIKEAPEKFVAGAIKAAKHEAKEWAEAGAGIKAAMSGKKMTDSQKKAVKTVAIEAAIVVTVTALTGGAAAGAMGLAKGVGATFAKSLAKKIALNAITNGLGGLTTMEELGHGAHGAMDVFHHVMDKFAADGKKLSEEDVFGQWVTAMVSKEIGKLSEEDLAAALEEVASNTE